MPLTRRAFGLGVLLLPRAARSQILVPNGLAFDGLSAAGAGGTPATTWDPAFNATGLTAGNTKINYTSVGTFVGWRSVASHSTGKKVVRITIGASLGGAAWFGLVPSVFAASGDFVTNYIGYIPGAGTIDVNGFGGCSGQPVATVTASQTLDISYDFTAQLLGFRPSDGNWNNSPTASPATGTGMFDVTCGGSTGFPPDPPPYYVGVSDASGSGETSILTLALVPDAGSGTLVGFSNW